MNTLTQILLCVLVFVVGAALGFFLTKIIPAFKAKQANYKAEKIIRDAEIKEIGRAHV